MSQNHDVKLHMQLVHKNALENVAQLVQARLVNCGWREQVRLATRKALEEDNDHLWNLDDIIAVVTPTARSMVPDTVKKELLHELEVIFGNIDKIK